MSPSTHGEAWTTTASARNLSRTHHRDKASHGQVTDCHDGLPSPVLDPEADADRVYQLLIEAMEAVRQAMVAIRNDMARAIRAAGI